MREGQCFSCYDNSMFQLFGQIKKYQEVNHSQVYIDNYRKVGCPVVECVTCSRKVEYLKQENGKWNEVKV